MYTIRQYYVPGADNTIYLTVQDEVTDAFAKEITDTAGNSRVQRNYYLNYNGADSTVGYQSTAESGNGNDPYNDNATANTFFDNYAKDGTGLGDAVEAQWTALDAGVLALAGAAGSAATADTLRGEASHYELPTPLNNGA
jgi:hypothetical protein